MAGELITINPWKSLSASIKRNKTRSMVAVAYFGSGGSRMLPLSKGSVLLVDASENTVKAGQTRPSELLLLYRKGVRIYSLAQLHAKIFLAGDTLFVGSTNVSGNSANNLVEALYKTKDKKSVSSAKKFIQSKCFVELGPKALKELQKIYRPPRFSGIKIKGKAQIKQSATSGEIQLFTFQLSEVEFNDAEKEKSQQGFREAKNKRVKKQDILLRNFCGMTHSKPPGMT